MHEEKSDIIFVIVIIIVLATFFLTAAYMHSVGESERARILEMSGLLTFAIGWKIK